MLGKILTRLSLVLASIAFSLLLGEVGLRLYQKIATGVPISVNAGTHIYLDGMAPVPFSCVLDEETGWKPTPNLRFQGEGQRADGSRYPLRVTQDENGFRAFGELTTRKPKVLFLGDSFTQAVEVSDDQTYYAEVGKNLDLEVFALGARGYSSFQEYLILDRVIDRILPDLIVWQFCFNDYMANAYEVERSWTASALGIPRPFWENGSVHHYIPESYAWLLQLFGGHSRFLSLMTIRYEQVIYRFVDGKKDVLLDGIYQHGLRDRGFHVAVNRTREILAMVSGRAKSTPIVIWEACTADEPFQSVLKDLAAQTGMHFVNGLPGDLGSPEHRGEVLYSIDRIHWDPEGHHLVAQRLTDYLAQSGLLRSPQR